MVQMILVSAINHEQVATLAALNVELPAGQAPEWIELIPAGPVVLGRDGRRWVNDRPEALLAAFQSDGRDIVIDTEHATEIRAPKGESAPAAGWIQSLELRGGSLWGRVSWTPAGAASVANREYRYVSPVFLYEQATSRIVRLTSVALTNQPNLRLAALNHQQMEEGAMLKKLLKALGLAEDADEATAMNAVAAMKTENQTLKADLATAKNRAETPDLGKFVPRADYDAAVSRAANAEGQLAAQKKADTEAEIAREVEGALKAGKIVPATKDYYMAMCRKEGGLEAFRSFLAAAPVIGDPSKAAGDPPAVHSKAVNAEELAVLQKMGIPEADYRKYNPAK